MNSDQTTTQANFMPDHTVVICVVLHALFSFYSCVCFEVLIAIRLLLLVDFICFQAHILTS